MMIIDTTQTKIEHDMKKYVWKILRKTVTVPGTICSCGSVDFGIVPMYFPTASPFMICKQCNEWEWSTPICESRWDVATKRRKE